MLLLWLITNLIESCDICSGMVVGFVKEVLCIESLSSDGMN